MVVEGLLIGHMLAGMGCFMTRRSVSIVVTLVVAKIMDMLRTPEFHVAWVVLGSVVSALVHLFCTVTCKRMFNRCKCKECDIPGEWTLGLSVDDKFMRVLLSGMWISILAFTFLWCDKTIQTTNFPVGLLRSYLISVSVSIAGYATVSKPGIPDRDMTFLFFHILTATAFIAYLAMY